MTRKSAFFALLLSLFSAPAFAQATPTTESRPATEARVPTFFGSTGLLTVPSAYTQGNRVVTPFFGGTGDFYGGGVLGGITDRFEIGAGAFSFDNDVDVLLNAKLLLLQEKRIWPALSVGVVDALDQLDRGPGWYVVASKYFTRSELEQRFALKGHLGYGGGIFDEEPFAGAELFFNRNLSAMAEYRDGDVSLGARYTYRGWAATLAWFDLDTVGGQISYSVRF